MLPKAKKVLAAAVAALSASSVLAAPLLNINIQGRVAGSGDAFSSSFSAAAGAVIEYQIVLDVAAIGTTNVTGATTRTINSLVAQTNAALPQGDGVGSLKFNLVANAAVFTAPGTINTDPVPHLTNDSWTTGGVGISDGVVANGGAAIDGIRPAHTPGVSTALDPEVLYSGTFTLGDGAVNIGGKLVNSGGMKINGGTNVPILGSSDTGADPLVAWTALAVTVGGGGDPNDSVLSLVNPNNGANVDLGNVLKGAKVGLAGTINKAGESATTFSLTGSGNVTVDPTSGNFGAGNGSASYNAAIDTSSFGAKSGTITLANTGEGATDANDVVTVSANVGIGGGSAVVAAGESLAGLGSQSDAGLGTTAEILGGTAGQNTTVVMDWSARPASTTPLNPLASDILTLEGLDGQVHVLQMSYEYQDGLFPDGVSEEEWAAAGGIFIATLEGGEWVNTVELNHGTNTGTGPVLGGWNGTLALGAWGVDTANNVAWAVIDHNSQFAVVPEPATFGLLGLGALGLLARRRRQA